MRLIAINLTGLRHSADPFWLQRGSYRCANKMGFDKVRFCIGIRKGPAHVHMWKRHSKVVGLVELMMFMLFVSSSWNTGFSRSAYYSVRSVAEWVVLIFEDKDQSCEVSVCKFPGPFALAIFHTCLREWWTSGVWTWEGTITSAPDRFNCQVLCGSLDVQMAVDGRVIQCRIDSGQALLR